ncbi:Thioesterase/thiol ester dehydrase-isomerase [Lichtheimia hyalospora FSU 10163]|nr:Thioesterase/thiol ester dehydrase-isomerase [Lichtheimia hyalospora FSU 10163]
MTINTPAAASDLSPLANAIYEHFEATGRLVRVALELEWTIFTRFIVGVIITTVITVIYLLLTMRNARQPLVIWERLNKPIIKLFRPWIFATLLNNADPYAQSIDLRIATFSKGFCTGFMRDHKRNRNPFKSIHATALATFAETIGGLALMSTLKNKDRAILVSLRMEYKKKARGLLTASSDFTPPALEGGKQEMETEVVIKDRMLDTVAIAHLGWLVESKEA